MRVNDLMFLFQIERFLHALIEQPFLWRLIIIFLVVSYDVSRVRILNKPVYYAFLTFALCHLHYVLTTICVLHSQVIFQLP